MTTTKIAEKIQVRMAELDDEQRMYENCRTICIGIKDELNKLLSSLEEDDKDREAGEIIVDEDETVSA